MGNLASCCHRPCPKEAVLFDPSGRLWRLPPHVKVAEVMLEAPGHVVAPVDQMLRSGRIAAMHADDELLTGKTYLVVLISRVNHKVDKAELAAIESKLISKRIGDSKQGEAKMKSKGGTLNVVPISEKEKNGNGVGGGRKPQLISCSRRQWNPMLEPILENH